MTQRARVSVIVPTKNVDRTIETLPELDPGPDLSRTSS